jgi:hypothetical protein
MFEKLRFDHPIVTVDHLSPLAIHSHTSITLEARDTDPKFCLLILLFLHNQSLDTYLFIPILEQGPQLMFQFYHKIRDILPGLPILRLPTYLKHHLL